jgi:hypothetical protein
MHKDAFQIAAQEGGRSYLYGLDVSHDVVVAEGPNHRSTARMIAEMPALLAALEEAREFLEELNWGGVENGARMERILAAIAKARP